jgi:hypothetical protein
MNFGLHPGTRGAASIDVALFTPGNHLGVLEGGRDGRRMTSTGSAEEFAADARA